MTAALKPLKRGTILPPTDPSAVARLSNYLRGLTQPAALIGPDNQRIELPIEVYDVLRRVVEAMGNAQAVTIAPVSRRLTTQEAADLLGISRPTLIKLIDEGKLPYETPTGGRHRRLLLSEVLDYQQRRKQDRDELLTKLVRDAEDDGLYDVSPDEFRAALREVRSERGKQG